MQQGTTFKTIKLTFSLVSEAQIWHISTSIKGELCQRCTGKFDFSHMTSSFCTLDACIWKKKTLCYGLEHGTRNLGSKFRPILKNTKRVLCRYVLGMQLAVHKHVQLIYHEYYYWLAFCGHVVHNHGLWSCTSTLVAHSCLL